MSRPRLVLSIAIAGLLAGTSIAGVSSLPLLGAAPAYAQQATLSFSVFFDKLQQGHWVRHPQYKYVWCPEVDRTWSPYTNGHWVYLENRGWYFASDEPFAWAVYHYGRWLQDADLGWCWVPGNVWAPAWVSWRRSSDYVGWAPLPPEGSGFAIGTTISTTEVPQDRWRFVPIRGFLQPQLSTEIVTVDKHPDVFQRSKPAGAVVVQNNIVVNTVINVNVIEQATKKRVPVVKTRTVDDPTQVGRSGQSDVISVFSAKLEAPKQDAAPKQVEDKAQAAQQLHNQPAGAAGATPQAGAAGANASSTTTSNTTTSNKTTSGNDASGAATSPAKPAATSNSTTTPAPSGSAAAKGSNGSAPAGAGETCAPNEKVNGKCPPTDNGKKKPAAATAAPAAQPGTPSGQQKGSSAGSSAVQKGAAGATGNNDQGTSGKPGRAATQAPTPAAKPQQPSRGQGAAPKGCAADQMVNGACPPAGNASGAGKGAAGDKSGNGASSGQSSGASSGSTARHNNDQNAPAAGRGAAANGPASQGGASQQKPPAKGKGQAVCPPNEVMVNGSCAPKGGAEPKTNDAPKQ